MKDVKPAPFGRHRLPALVVRALLVAGLAAMLGGCYTSQEVTGTVPDDYRLRHPITVKEAARTVELFIGTNRGGLNPLQRADVLAFAQAWRRESTGGIVIEAPAGTGNERAAAEAMHEVQSIFAAAGIPAQGVAVRSYHPASPRSLATLKLTYPKMTADAGPCGLWPKDLGPALNRDYNENTTYWNFGCASQRNLAAMVDNPEDLVQPRGETPPYAARRTVVLDKYRRGDNTQTNYPNSDQQDPRITDIGK